jgi:hypothetical protein
MVIWLGGWAGADIPTPLNVTECYMQLWTWSGSLECHGTWYLESLESQLAQFIENNGKRINRV